MTQRIRETYNRFDLLLGLMMLLMVFGSSFGFFQPIRVLHLLLLPCMLYDTFRGNRQWLGRYRGEVILAGVWILYAGISLHWRMRGIECAKLMVHLCIYLSSLFEVLWLASQARNPRKTLLMSWIAMVGLTLPIALWEFITDHHLPTCDNAPMQKLYYGPDQAILRRFAAVTFDNINAYNTILTYSLFPILLWIYQARERWEKVAGYALWIFAGATILTNASRASITCLVASVVLFLVLARKRQERILGAVGMLLLLGWFVLDSYGISVFPQVVLCGDGADVPGAISGRMLNQGLDDIERHEIYTISWDICQEDHFLGCGIGNIPARMHQHGTRYTAPHCLWLEVILQFGIIGLLIFLLLYLRIFVEGIRGDYRAMLIGLMLVAGMSISDGTILYKAHTWMMIATLFVLTDKNYAREN